MPIMDGRGAVLCGGGGLQGSLNGEILPFETYGGGCWYDDLGTALEQLREAPAGARDAAGKLRGPGPTLAFWRPAAAPEPLPRAANDFAGGGGAFVAWLAGFGVWGSLETRLSGTPEEIRATLAVAGTCGPRSVAPDGTIAYIPNRQDGYGIMIIAPNGSAVMVPGIAPTDVQVLEAGVAIWRGGAHGRAPTRPALVDAQGVQLQFFNGRDWLLYWSEARGCILQADGAAYGYVLDARPYEFNPHMRVVGAELRIAWSITQGEGPNDLVICALTADGSIRYLRGADRWIPAAAQWIDLTAPITPPVEPPIEPPPVKPPIEPPPVKPPIQPPPVKPPPAFYHHKRGTPMTEIDGKIVVMRGPKGMLMRPDAPGTGIWGTTAEPKGTWRGAKFDVGDSGDTRAHHKATKLASGRYKFVNVEQNCIAGQDGGWYTPNVLQQFYYKPTGEVDDSDAGDLEQARVYDGNENGAIEAQMEQTTDDQHPSGAGKKFFAYPLSIEVVE